MHDHFATSGVAEIGYRLTDEHSAGGAGLVFVPAASRQELFSGFVQDEIAIVPQRLSLIAGAKLEHNSFSGFEVQPSGRLPQSGFLGLRCERSPPVNAGVILHQ